MTGPTLDPDRIANALFEAGAHPTGDYQSREPCRCVGAECNCNSTYWERTNHRPQDPPHRPREHGETCLERAKRVVEGKRQEDYGAPLTCGSRIAHLWTAYLDARPSGPLTAEDVWFLNLLQKVGRSMHSVTADGLADMAGYAYVVEICQRERERLKGMEE